jgi:hypothetical protein
MAELLLRCWTCETGPSEDGTWQVTDIRGPVPYTPEVRLSAVVLTNALATPVTGQVAFRSRQHELRLLLSYLDETGGPDLRLRHPALTSSAGHIQRFVSESLGMGLLTASVEAVHGWRADHRVMANFDVLPAHLKDRYPLERGRVRPDLLFRLPKLALAGEARGRTRPRMPLSVQADQRKRLNELAQWSHLHGDHPFVMAWTWLTARGLLVDLFRLESGTDLEPVIAAAQEAPAWAPGDVEIVPGWRKAAAGRAEERCTEEVSSEPDTQWADSVSEPHTAPWGHEVSDEEMWVRRSARSSATRPRARRRSSPDATPVSTLLSGADRHVRDVVASLYETAPALGGTPELCGVPVRGAWTRADLMGPSVTRMFLGVLEAPLPEGRPTGRTGTNADTDVCVADRLVTAVTRSPQGLPPWTVIQQAVEGS